VSRTFIWAISPRRFCPLVCLGGSGSLARARVAKETRSLAKPRGKMTALFYLVSGGAL
jgi:hypothetical protein